MPRKSLQKRNIASPTPAIGCGTCASNAIDLHDSIYKELRRDIDKIIDDEEVSKFHNSRHAGKTTRLKCLSTKCQISSIFLCFVILVPRVCHKIAVMCMLPE